MNTKRITYLAATLALATAAASCEHEEIYEPLEFSVQLAPTNTYRTGDPVVFNFSGNADFITVWTGDTGHEYKHRNRTKVDIADIESCELEIEISQQYGTLNNLVLFAGNKFAGLNGSDAAGRVKDLAEEIGWIESRRDEMLSFWSKVEDGTIPTRVTHNDTKINNILFNKQGEVLCAIDLDTVMNSTSLNDFGDAIRSYTNTGDEDDRDLSRVGMSLEMFRAYTEGYLSQRAGQLNQAEIDHLAFSARYITFEQVLRFLMDYIDGDTYYKTKYPEHNLVRTRAQYKLLQSMEEQYGTMCEIVRETVAKYK